MSGGRERLTRWLPALLLMGVIWTLSSQPSFPTPDDPLLKTLLLKGGHMIGYGMLAASYAWALGRGRGRRALWGALGLTLLYAISDEWHQTWVPGRNGQPLDVLIDFVGGIGGLLVWNRLGERDQVDLPPERPLLDPAPAEFEQFEQRQK